MPWSCALLAALSLAQAAAPRTLVVCDDVEDPMTLDPHREFSEKNHTLVQQIFEGLVRFGPEGSIEPVLATEWRRLDELRVEFKLRRGVVFHNGEPFTAASVRFSVERYLDPATGFPARGYIDSLDKVEVVDEHTVTVVTRYPDGLLLNRLAGFILIVPERHYRESAAEALRERPVGSGAFEFGSWEKGRRVVLKANRRYWDPRYPRVDELVFRFIPNEGQVDALLRGEIDVLMSLPGTRTLEVQRNPGTVVQKKLALYTMAGNFNLDRPPLSDRRVREAINLAVDRKDLIRYDILGNGIPLATLGLPDEFGTDSSLKPYPHDPRRARRLLAEAGYPAGFELQVLLKVNAERAGRILARQLGRVGIRMNFTPVTDAQLFERLKERGRWDMAIYSCPDPMHHAFFIRSIFVAGSSPFALASDPGIDERLGRLVRTLDLGEQRKVSEELDRYIHAEFLALPTYQRLGVYGVRRGVDFTPYKSGMPYFHAAAIHEDKNP